MNKLYKALLATALTGVMLSQTVLAANTNIYVNTSAHVAKLNEEWLNSDFNKSENVYLASDEYISDALVGGVLASEKKSKLLFSSEYKNLTQENKEKIKNLVILGGDTAVSSSDLGLNENQYKRIFGANRYDTAVKIAENLGTNRGVVIASGTKFADAVSSTSYAAKNNLNILLVDKDQVPKETANYLEKYSMNKEITFVGGSDSISNETKKTILKLVGDNRTVEEATVAGQNRYETSKLLAERTAETSSLVFADGESFKKSLVASIMASETDAKFYMINTKTKLPDYISNSIDKIKNMTLFSDIENLSKQLIEELTSNNTLFVDGNKTDSKSIKIQDKNEVASGDVIEENKIDVKSSKENDATDNRIHLANGDIIDKDNKIITLANGTVKRYTAIIEMNTTAYNIFPGSTGYTASGTPARPGAVAVDPNVIPLGTKLYIQSTDDWPSYGLATAEDTGGAIIGNKLDLFYYDYDTVEAFGRRTTITYILED